MKPAEPAESVRARSRGRTIALLLTLAVAALVRTVALDRWPAINGDESWYGVNVQELLTGGTPFWHTGIGNPLSPIHSGLLLALSTVTGPSALVLRAPEVLLGLLAVAIAYPLLSRPLGPRAALLTAMFLAVSPTAVAYSRLGWDPSGTPLMTLLAIGAALLDRPVLALIASGMAFFVHPTNLFVMPIVAAAWAPHAVDKYRAASPAARRYLLRAAIVSAIIAVPVGAWMAIRIAGNPNTSLPSVSMVIERVTSPQLWATRTWGFVDLLSGISTVIHIAAPVPAGIAAMANIVLVAVLLASLWGGWRLFRSHRYAWWLCAGIAVAFAGFHVVAMGVALAPTSERYGVFMLVPMTIVLAIAIDAWIERHRWAYAAAGLTTALMLAVLLGGYFYPLASFGGDAMTTYRTGATEPKLAAFEFVASDSGSDRVQVVADGWWLYWTLRYFAGPDGRITVDPAPNTNMPGGIRPAGAPAPAVPPSQRTYVIAFAGSPFPATLTSSAPIFTAVDPIGRPIVEVFAVSGR
jgi:hypothetical protein